MIVLDASALLEILLNTADGIRLRNRIQRERSSLHAPHLIDIEIGHVLRRYEHHGDIDAERGGMALVDLADIRMQRYGHTAFLPRIWDLRANLTGYDAAYVALAEALDAPLVTADARLARAPGHDATIERL